MPLDAQDIEQIRTMFTQLVQSELPKAIEIDRLKAKEDRFKDAEKRAEKERKEPEKEVKLYLVTFGGHYIAIPDQNGRAVHSTAVYARMTRVKNAWDQGFNTVVSDAEIVATGDGYVLDPPLKGHLMSGMTAMVEVAEGAFKPKTMTAGS